MVVGQLTYKFEELPIIRFGHQHVAGLIDGEALVQFTDDRAWHIERLWIEMAFIPKPGQRGRSELVELSELLQKDFGDLASVLDEERRDEIQAAVDAAIKQGRAA